MIILGPMQIALMRIMWKLEKSHVKRIYAFMILTYDSKITYTSVLTTLNILVDKGFLKKRKIKKEMAENHYSVGMKPQKYNRSLIKVLCKDYFKGKRASMIQFIRENIHIQKESQWTLIPLHDHNNWDALYKKSQRKNGDFFIKSFMLILNRISGSLHITGEDYHVLITWSRKYYETEDFPFLAVARRKD